MVSQKKKKSRLLFNSSIRIWMGNTNHKGKKKHQNTPRVRIKENKGAGENFLVVQWLGLAFSLLWPRFNLWAGNKDLTSCAA